MLRSLVAFSGGYKECSQVTLPCLTPTYSELFLWAPSGCAHVSFSLAMHYPYFLMFILTDGNHFSGPCAWGLAVWMWEGSCYHCSCFVKSGVPLPLLCWRGSDEACSILVCASPSALSLENLCSISIVCLSDVGYADCIFISVMLPWFTLPLTNLWLLFSPFLFFC